MRKIICASVMIILVAFTGIAMMAGCRSQELPSEIYNKVIWDAPRDEYGETAVELMYYYAPQMVQNVHYLGNGWVYVEVVNFEGSVTPYHFQRYNVDFYPIPSRGVK